MRHHLFAVGLSLLFRLNSQADSWPQWMGPNRDAVWREDKILNTFPAKGPEINWRIEIDGGYAGPAVVGDRLYITDRKAGPPATRKKGEKGPPWLPGQERIACFSASSGELIWEHRYDCPYQIDYPSGPRATPVVAGGRVYTLGAMGDLLCLDATSGAVRWEKHFLKDYSLEQPVWGWAAHPLLHEGALICLVGGKESAVVAMDADSGKELWRALTSKEIGYAPPIIAKVGGREQLIVWHPEGIVGLDPKSGSTLWNIPYPVHGKAQRPEVTIAMPRVFNGSLFISSFYHGSLMLRLDENKPEISWDRYSSSKSSFNAGLHTTMSTPVFKDGYVYGICGGGELRCLDAKTGARVWETLEPTGGKAGPFASAFLTQHENRFFIWNDQGDLIIAKLTPEKYEEISRAHLLDPLENTRGREIVWGAPAFANRCFYARNSKELICVSLEAKG